MYGHISFDMSKLNMIVQWIYKIYILILIKIYCTYMQYQELSLSSQYPKLVLCTHKYTCSPRSKSLSLNIE